MLGIGKRLVFLIMMSGLYFLSLNFTHSPTKLCHPANIVHKHVIFLFSEARWSVWRGSAASSAVVAGVRHTVVSRGSLQGDAPAHCLHGIMALVVPGSCFFSFHKVSCVYCLNSSINCSLSVAKLLFIASKFPILWKKNLQN